MASAVGVSSVLGATLALPRRWVPWRALFVEPSRERFPVRGVDVSHHQGAIDWARVKASGQSFAFIKASEGADFRDERFVENWQRARAQGLLTGAYHFFTFCSPGLAQAENFLAVAPREAGALPLAVDVEFTGNCQGWESIDAIRQELLIFEEHVQAHIGHAPMPYITDDVRLELVPNDLRDNPYWLRSLWGEPGNAVRWRFWQYSDTGSVPGINGEVDLDVFAGPRASWQQVIDGTLHLD